MKIKIQRNSVSFAEKKNVSKASERLILGSSLNFPAEKKLITESRESKGNRIHEKK